MSFQSFSQSVIQPAIQSVTFRVSIILLLVLVLQIPAFMIRSLISERQTRRDQVISEVSSKWGDEQTIAGPVLTIPFREVYMDKSGEEFESVSLAHFLPEDLNIKGVLSSEKRHRGIFETVLYSAKISFDGSFLRPTLNLRDIGAKEILWNDSYISIGISHMKGIRELIHFNWNNKKMITVPGIPPSGVLASGVNMPLNLEQNAERNTFSFDIDINGSHGLYFLPLGKVTEVTLSSEWSNPSFLGNFLPDEYQITDDGFKAHWNILNMNRNYPQSWIGSGYNIKESRFGLDLFLPVDQYQKSMRTVKYSLMFIGLTFLTFFMIELKSKIKLHPIHYLLIGFAALVFYSLLLSLSEHINFGYAYIAAAAGVIFLITAYSGSILQNRRFSSIIFSILSILYGYLYIILNLQDLALLIGNLGLFIILGLVMYLTRQIDWYAAFKTDEANQRNNSGKIGIESRKV